MGASLRGSASLCIQIGNLTVRRRQRTFVEHLGGEGNSGGKTTGYRLLSNWTIIMTLLLLLIIIIIIPLPLVFNYTLWLFKAGWKRGNSILPAHFLQVVVKK